MKPGTAVGVPEACALPTTGIQEARSGAGDWGQSWPCSPGRSRLWCRPHLVESSPAVSERRDVLVPRPRSVALPSKTRSGGPGSHTPPTHQPRPSRGQGATRPDDSRERPSSSFSTRRSDSAREPPRNATNGSGPGPSRAHPSGPGREGGPGCCPDSRGMRVGARRRPAREKGAVSVTAPEARDVREHSGLLKRGRGHG